MVETHKSPAPLIRRFWPGAGDLTTPLETNLPEFWVGDSVLGRAALTAPHFAAIPDLIAFGRPDAVASARVLLSGITERELLAGRPAAAAERIWMGLEVLPRLFDPQDSASRAISERFCLAAKTLLRKIGEAKTAQRQLSILCAVAAGSVCAPRGSTWHRALGKALEAQCRKLRTEATEPGLLSNANRNSEELLESFRRLVWLKQLAERHELNWQPVHGAVEDLTAVFRSLRMGNSELPHGQGSSRGNPERLDRALLDSGVRDSARPKTALGYSRIFSGRTAVLIDCGKPPAAETATAGTLSLEMSTGRRMLIVNGGPAVEGYQHSVAHSALVVAATSSTEFSGRKPLHRPENVSLERALDRAGHWLLASHDGYRRQFGVLHERRLFLAPAGNDLRGEDTLSAQSTRDRSVLALRIKDTDAPLPFALHFHLHPDVLAREITAGIDLELPSGESWSFRCSGGEIALRPSQVTVDNQPRDTLQIVIAAEMSDISARVNWALRRSDDRVRFTRDPFEA